MPKGDNITTKFSADISNLKAGLTEANKDMKLAQAQFKAVASETDKYGKSADGLKAKIKDLSTEYDKQKKILDENKARLEEAKKKQDEKAKSVEDLKKKLQELKDNGVSPASKEYKEYEEKLKQAEKESRLAEKATYDLEKAVADQSTQVNKSKAEIDKYKDELEKVEASAKKPIKSLEELGDKIGKGLKKAIAIGTTALAGAVAGMAKSAYDMTKSTAELGKEVNINSQKIGMSKTAYQEWAYVLKKSGMEVESLGTPMIKFQKTLAKFTEDGKTSKDAFDKLGLSMSDLKNKTPEQAFDIVIGKLQQMPAGFERTKVASDLLGKGAKDMGVLLNKSADETQNLKDKAHALGLVLSDDEITGATKFTSAMGGIKDTMTGLKMQIGNALMPILSKLGGKISEALTKVDMKKIIDSLSGSVGKLADKAGDFIEKGITKLVDVIPKIIDFITFVIDHAGAIAGAIAGIMILTTIGKISAGISGIIGIFTTLIPVLWAGATAGWAFIAPFLPIIGIVAGIIAIIVGVVLAIKNWGAIVDWFKGIWGAFVGWITGVFAPVGDFFKNLWSGVVDTFSWVFNLIKTIITTYINIWITILTTLWNGIKAIFEGIKSVIMTVWNSIVNFLTPIINAIKNTITTVFEGIKNTITTIFNAIKTTISTVINTIKSTIDSVFNAIKNTATSIWNGIKTAMTTPIQAGADLIKGIVEKIKGFFNFKITFPKIPMPHFGISPAGWKVGDLLQGKIPKLKVDWYAKGGYGLANKPVITPQGQGFGEAGREAFIPLSKQVLSTIGNAIVEATIGFGDNSEMVNAIKIQTREIVSLKQAIYENPLVLDDGTLIGKRIGAIDKALGEINGYRLRGLAI